MTRAAAILMLAGGLLAAGVASAAPDVPVDRTVSAQADLMRAWGAVGKCVVQRDRATSIAFVRAAMGSDEAIAAGRRLDPVFASCLAGSGVPGPSSIVLRRAALAQALGLSRSRT